ncbi:hypothetical protein [Candidatus Steffania adelgidicola]|uniref:hypothetical protein n=1 Tax=Candidatus Steffania adelgidicola TaxID=1076626 RepID=UPI001D019842|nr:hypothetical protein [Candidatus Steffania adelgidicola]
MKYDALNLKLRGKDEKKICNMLTKRYQLSMRRLLRNNSEDIFKLFMNACANEIDPHMNYLSLSNTEQFNSNLSLLLDDIGAALQMNDDCPLIHTLTPPLGPEKK